MVSFRDAFEDRQSPPGVSVTPVAGFIGTIQWLEDLWRLLGAASCAFSRIGLHGSLPLLMEISHRDLAPGVVVVAPSGRVIRGPDSEQIVTL
jgi:hypothetical protein